MTRQEHEILWLRLTREVMPSLAKERQWPVRNDHCFQRIIFDTICNGVWYDRIHGRPAYRHIDHEGLSRANRLAQDIIVGDADLSTLNAQSLAWRRAAKQRGTGSQVKFTS